MTPVLLTRGDILDRLSIMEIKSNNGLDIDYLPFDRFINCWPQYQDEAAYKELKEVNNSLWILEDRIRDAHNADDLDTSQVTFLSAAIIQHNWNRSEIKKSIDGENAEPKKYAMPKKYADSDGR